MKTTEPRKTDPDQEDLTEGSESTMLGDSDEGYRPFFWYDKDYNIPDECRFYI